MSDDNDESGWTLEAIFHLGNGVQVAVASTKPLRSRDWYYLGRMLDVTREIAVDRVRLDREAAARAATADTPTADERGGEDEGE